MRSLFCSWGRLLIMPIKRHNGRTAMRRKMTGALVTMIFSAVANADRLIYEDQIGGWIFSYPTELAVSSDEKLATFGRGPQFGMVDLATGRLLDGIPEGAQFAAFVGSKDTVAFDTGDGWQTDIPGAAAIESLPSNIIQRWDESRTQVAFFRAGHRRRLANGYSWRRGNRVATQQHHTALGRKQNAGRVLSCRSLLPTPHRLESPKCGYAGSTQNDRAEWSHRGS